MGGTCFLAVASSFSSLAHLTVDYSICPSKNTQEKKTGYPPEDIQEQKKKEKKKTKNPNIRGSRIEFYSGRPSDGSPGESYK